MCISREYQLHLYNDNENYDKLNKGSATAGMINSGITTA